MQARGFTLIESLLVVCLIAILLAIALPTFSGYFRHYQVEAQTRLIYSQLQQARANALFQRRSIRVKLFRDHFETYSSAQDLGAAPVQTATLHYPITCNGSGDGIKGYPIDFDQKGLTTDWCSICLESFEPSSSLDSIVISANRVMLGTRDKGYECTKDNITPR